MLGTAFPAARLLLVEQPGPWGRRGLCDSRFDPAIAAALEHRVTQAGFRVQAVRRPGRTARGARRHWAIVDTRNERQSLHFGTFDADAELLELPLDDHGGTRADVPVYLVCAHGKHDACCALRGRSVAAAIEEFSPGQVWETSHLGGDRFAANVLVLPSGLLYGRVLPFAAKEFVAAADAGEVVGALLRGRIGLPPAGQAALAFAHDHLALRRRNDLQVDSVSPVRDGRSEVLLRSPYGELAVTVQVERVRADGLTCSAPGPGVYLRYRPTLVVPLDD